MALGVRKLPGTTTFQAPGTHLSQPTAASGSSADIAHSGSWRPDADFDGLPGLKVTLRRIAGLTVAGVLEVPLRFQVPPTGDFGREWGYEYAKYTTLRLGERSRPMSSPLSSLDISTLLMDAVAQDDAGLLVVWPHAPDPQRILRELRWIMGEPRGATPTPFRLVISEMAVWDEFLVNGTYVLTRVRATQRQIVGTEFVDLSFEEFDRLDVDVAGEGIDRWHRLKAGDTLYEIAKRYYRSPSSWRTIATANSINRSVDPGSSSTLASWAKRHDRKSLKIPPKPSG